MGYIGKELVLFFLANRRDASYLATHGQSNSNCIETANHARQTPDFGLSEPSMFFGVGYMYELFNQIILINLHFFLDIGNHDMVKTLFYLASHFNGIWDTC